jgi:flavodoxin
MKAVVVFYSQTCGNTRKIAEMIALTTGAALAEIKTVEDYGRDYDAVMVRARDEINSGFLPEIRPLSADLSEYDTVIIGTPTWWYTMAPAVRKFLRSTDLTGKRVYAFQTHGGQPGSALKDMRRLSKGENISDFMVEFDSMGGSQMKTSIDELRTWIQSIQ